MFQPDRSLIARWSPPFFPPCPEMCALEKQSLISWESKPGSSFSFLLSTVCNVRPKQSQRISSSAGYACPNTSNSQCLQPSRQDLEGLPVPGLLCELCWQHPPGSILSTGARGGVFKSSLFLRLEGYCLSCSGMALQHYSLKNLFTLWPGGNELQ